MASQSKIKVILCKDIKKTPQNALKTLCKFDNSFWINFHHRDTVFLVKATDRTFYWFTGMITHMGS